MFSAVSNVVIEYNHKGRWSCEGNTAEEIYDSLNLYGTTEKPPKDEFITKLEAEHQKIQLNALRRKRNVKLAECDWTQMSDVALANKDEWKTYRQALRDLPETTTDYNNVVYPSKPSTELEAQINKM